MTIQSLAQAGRVEIVAIAARHSARNLRIFGSVARGEANESSDLDLLVDLDGGRTLLDLGGLVVELEAQLGVRVDVTIERMLRREIRESR